MSKIDESTKTLLKCLDIQDLFKIRDSLQVLADYGLADRDLVYQVYLELEERAKR